jgi:hypothetical protein
VAQPADFLQQVGRALSGFNYGNVNALIVDATISGANTYATLVARVTANINAPGLPTETNQFGNVLLLPSLAQGNLLSILTDTNLNGLTTVAQVQNLFVQEDPRLPLNYTANTLN